MTREEAQLAEDLIRALLFDVAERIAFGPNAFDERPFTKAFGELATRYGVPSITDVGAVVRPAPQVPEGKVKNG